MLNERRTALRKPLVYSIVLNYTGVGLLRARTRDISETGMFLELDRIKLNQFAQIDVGFSLREDDEIVFHRLTGTVVRVTHEGAAVQFQKNDANVLKLLNSAIERPTT